MRACVHVYVDCRFLCTHTHILNISGACNFISFSFCSMSARYVDMNRLWHMYFENESPMTLNVCHETQQRMLYHSLHLCVFVFFLFLFSFQRVLLYFVSVNIKYEKKIRISMRIFFPFRFTAVIRTTFNFISYSESHSQRIFSGNVSISRDKVF